MTKPLRARARLHEELHGNVHEREVNMSDQTWATKPLRTRGRWNGQLHRNAHERLHATHMFKNAAADKP